MTEREEQSMECLRIAREETDFQTKINYAKKAIRFNKNNVDAMIYLLHLSNLSPDDFAVGVLTILNELDLNSEDYAKAAITYSRCMLMESKNRQVIEMLSPILDELNAKDYLLWAYLAREDYDKALNIYYEYFMDDNLLYLAGIMYLFFKKDHIMKASAYYDRIKLHNPFFFAYLIQEKHDSHIYLDAYNNYHSSDSEFAYYTIDTFIHIIENDVEFIEFVKNLM